MSPGRAGRARKGTAALHDKGHRRARRAQSGNPDAASDGPAPGVLTVTAEGRDLVHQARRLREAWLAKRLQELTPQERATLRAAAPDSGEAQPVLSAPAASGHRMFKSLGTRNYRLFATGQVVSNTGSWMQRVAQDWLVLELTHGSGTALGITTGLQFLPMLFSMYGGMVADRYPKRRILMATQATDGRPRPDPRRAGHHRRGADLAGLRPGVRARRGHRRGQPDPADASPPRWSDGTACRTRSR